MELFLKHKRVEKYMSSEVRNIDISESVFNGIKIMTHYNISCLITTSKGEPVGIITERDIMRRVALENKNLKKTKVADVMSTPLITKDSNTKIDEIIELMNRYSIRRVVVMDGDDLKGIITQTDIVRLSKKFIDIIDVVKLYFFILIGMGLIAGLYLLMKYMV